MVFVTFLEPGARHAYAACITELLYLALHLKESGGLCLIHFRSCGVGAFVLIFRPHLIVAGRRLVLHP